MHEFALMHAVMNMKAYSLQSHDFTEMQDALSAWDHDYRQVSAGAFQGSLLHSQIGSLGIFHNRWERAIHYRGSAPKGTIGLAVTLAQTTNAIWNGHQMAFDDVLLQRAGAEAEYFSASLWDSVVFAIPETQLAKLISDLTNDNPEKILAGHGIYRLTSQFAAQIRQACIAYLRSVKRSLERPAETSRLSEMAESVVELLACALVYSQYQHGNKLGLTRQRALVRRARDYAEESMAQPLQISQLCRDLDTSERTLHHAFLHQTGMAPLSFFKTARLNQAYRLLSNADPVGTLIKDIALTTGFRQFGQFSRDYRKLFGELPSETLRSNRTFAKLPPV